MNKLIYSFIIFEMNKFIIGILVLININSKYYITARKLSQQLINVNNTLEYGKQIDRWWMKSHDGWWTQNDYFCQYIHKLVPIYRPLNSPKKDSYSDEWWVAAPIGMRSLEFNYICQYVAPRGSRINKHFEDYDPYYADSHPSPKPPSPKPVNIK